MEIIDDADVLIKITCPFCGREQEWDLEDFEAIQYQENYYEGIERACVECGEALLIIKPERVC